MRRTHLALCVAAVSAIAAAVACGGSTPRTEGEFPVDVPIGGSTGTTGGGSTTGGAGTGADAGTPGDLGGTGVVGNDGCLDESRLVYVVSSENDLYSFEPAKLRFTRIGTLQCQSGGALPNSMAVDRTGTAWVNYDDGRIFKVSTRDASCVATDFAVNQHDFGKRFGMGFSADAKGSTAETLFVSNLAGLGLAKVDTTTLELVPVGQYSGDLAPTGGELTGTGDARLFGFFQTSPATLAEITKTTAATPEAKPLPSVETGTAWAFSFWGGDFWFYTADTSLDAGDTSRVTRLKAATDNSLSVVLENIGFRIVGAGVSTCAPVTPPS